MFATCYSSVRSSQGVSLIECLIAISISVLVIGMLGQLYVSSLKNHQVQLTLNRLLMNARKATAILVADIKKAGYIGCPRLYKDFPISGSNPLINTDNWLIGEGNRLSLRYVDFPSAILLEDMSNASTFQVSRTISFTAGDWVCITDCQQAEIFRIAKVINVTKNQQKIIASEPLQHFFRVNAEIGKIKMHQYYLARSQRKSANNTPSYSLFLEDTHQRKHELVQGMDALQFVYTVKTHGLELEKNSKFAKDGYDLVGVAINLSFSSANLKKNWYSYAALKSHD